MCGIMGCVGSDAVDKVYKGLVRLEYRGYDSAGISALAHGSICTVKRAGMVSRLKDELTSLHGDVAIGHTRWATHGAPSDENAHPHTAGKFSVVHNGIIENYSDIKRMLIREGCDFKSQTDSEVIVHLLNKYYKGDFLSAVKSTVNELKGSFALCILCADCDGIAVVRSRNPIIIGKGDGCFFASSDMPALAGEAVCAYVLKDEQIAYITKDSATLYDFGFSPVEFAFSLVNSTISDTALCGYPHYMLKEINEIPAAVKNTISAFDDECRSALKRLYLGVNRVIFTGCGTAFHSALIGACVFEELTQIPAYAHVASELRYKSGACFKNALLIAVSQSGETADTVEAARFAKENGAKVVAVTNVQYSALNDVADVVVPVRAGTEACVAATKSFCAQTTALILAAQAVSGKTVQGLNSLASACAQVVKSTDVQEFAKLCVSSQGVYFIGRGTDYPVALEGSLKLKEISYIASEGYPAGELKHGTLALIDKNTLSVAIITDSALAPKVASSVKQIRSRGGKTAVIATKSCITDDLTEDACVLISIPDVSRYLSPVLSVIPLQYAAYNSSVMLGRNPDKPRNLAKSVTVE